jgi:hypothetical protein
MTENENILNTENDVKKKGRKPKLNNYFDEREENAVRMYLTATTFEEKNKVEAPQPNSKIT